MIRHLLKLIWNRKRSNFLIMLEIFFSFLVLSAVATLGMYYLDNYRQPLGFDWKPLWVAEINTRQSSEAEIAARLRELLPAVEAFDEVEAAALTRMEPYSFSSWNSGATINGREMSFDNHAATDKMPQVAGLQLVAGRWFGRADDVVSGKEPVVINERFAREIFGNESPLGKPLYEPDKTEKPQEIIGVIRDYRKDGEFASPVNVVFHRSVIQHDTAAVAGAVSRNRSEFPRMLLMRMHPGTKAQFEETLHKRLRAVGGDWSFEIKPVAQQRSQKHALYLTPLIVAGIVAGFLLLMVALGLIGVIWQNVTARSAEIGLRRAAGATAGDILRQILMELTLLATLGMSLGILLVLQFPVLDLISGITAKVYLLALLLSIGIIYAITLLSGLYPSMLATRVQPTQALNSD
jgi:putative ABC transport system permease protein